MAENQTSETNKDTQKKKGLPTIAIVGIGCIVFIVLITTLVGVAGSFLFSRFGTGILKKGIEQKTGFKIDQDNEGFTFTDSKTGNEVSIGSQKIPDNFPKDFPIYPGAKPTGSLSGNGENDASGFWITLTTTDGKAIVRSYYETELKKNGWTVKDTISAEELVTFTLKKGQLDGSVSISTDSDATETTIIVALETKTDSVMESEAESEEGSM